MNDKLVIDIPFDVLDGLIQECLPLSVDPPGRLIDWERNQKAAARVVYSMSYWDEDYENRSGKDGRVDLGSFVITKLSASQTLLTKCPNLQIRSEWMGPSIESEKNILEQFRDFQRETAAEVEAARQERTDATDNAVAEILLSARSLVDKFLEPGIDSELKKDNKSVMDPDGIEHNSKLRANLRPHGIYRMTTAQAVTSASEAFSFLTSVTLTEGGVGETRWVDVYSDDVHKCRFTFTPKGGGTTFILNWFDWVDGHESSSMGYRALVDSQLKQDEAAAPVVATPEKKSRRPRRDAIENVALIRTLVETRDCLTVQNAILRYRGDQGTVSKYWDDPEVVNLSRVYASDRAELNKAKSKAANSKRPKKK